MMSSISRWLPATRPSGSGGLAGADADFPTTSGVPVVSPIHREEGELFRFRLRWTFLFAGLVQAVGMLVDAFQLMRDATIPADETWMWARVVEGVGLDPARVGPIFLV